MKNITPLFDVLPALDSFSYLDELKLYYAYFGSIPSVKRMQNLDLTAVKEWIESDRGFLQKHYSSKKWIPIEVTDVESMSEVIVYILEEKVLVKLEDGSMSIVFGNDKEGCVDGIIQRVEDFKVEYSRNEIHLVISTPNGIETERLTFREPEMILEKHYNDDLKPMHDKLMSTLHDNNKSGLVLFYGMPGTGKSTYIRSLICGIEKKVIFLTPELAGALGSPQISKFLIRNSGSVFVIEDAEQLLVSRESGRNSSISTILNLTDGILGESLGIQIIATFNSDLYNIDKALLRKGRMIAMYEFKPLEIQKSTALLADLGAGHVEVAKPMTLADIYNYGESRYEIARHRNGIGFKN